MDITFAGNNARDMIPSQEKIKAAAEIVRRGGVVAFPTETVYGLGACATKATAVARIFEIKKRPDFDPLIVHVRDREMANEVIRVADRVSEDLMERFWPGPLTLVVSKKPEIPDIVTSGLHTVAVRMPDNETALRLISEAGCPLAAPSANPFGYLSPTTAQHVEQQLGGAVDMILDGGPCGVGIESTIVRVNEGEIEILRYGGIAPDELRKVAPVREGGIVTDGVIPGALPFHYSPHTPLILTEGMPENTGKKEGRLYCSQPKSCGAGDGWLTTKGDMKEAAVRLFSELHRLDAMGLERIYVERVPEKGLGIAIMDRLRKAAARHREE